jgi:hypothetical protein
MIERAHRQLKDSLRSRLAGVYWPQHLPWVLLGLRAAPKEDSGTSSAELVLGAPLTLPGQFLSSLEPSPPPVSQFVETLQNSSPSLPTRPLSYAEVALCHPHEGRICVCQTRRSAAAVGAALLWPLLLSLG